MSLRRAGSALFGRAADAAPAMIPVSDGLASPTLPCSGCAHSDAQTPFPGRPSGERPCCFCTRNPDLQAQLDEHLAGPTHIDEGCRHPCHGVWYDGTPASRSPMDCYISTARLGEQRRFAG